MLPTQADQAVYVFGLIASTVLFIGTVVVVALKIQRHITGEFEKNRKLMYSMFEARDRSIRSLQFWAIRQGGKDPYQPAAEPLELLAADRLNKNGNNNGNGSH